MHRVELVQVAPRAVRAAAVDLAGTGETAGERVGLRERLLDLTHEVDRAPVAHAQHARDAEHGEPEREPHARGAHDRALGVVVEARERGVEVVALEREDLGVREARARRAVLELPALQDEVLAPQRAGRLDAARAARDAAAHDHERVAEADRLLRDEERRAELHRDLHDELLAAAAQVPDLVEPARLLQ